MSEVPPETVAVEESNDEHLDDGGPMTTDDLVADAQNEPTTGTHPSDYTPNDKEIPDFVTVIRQEDQTALDARGISPNRQPDRPLNCNTTTGILSRCGKIFKFGNSAPNIVSFDISNENTDTDRLDLLLKLHTANAGRLQHAVNWIVQRMNWLLYRRLF